MNWKNQEAIARMCLIAALTALLIVALVSSNAFPIIIDGTCPPKSGDHIAKAFWCRVHSWQTLIAGLLAVLGAMLTIRHMRREVRWKDLQRIWVAVGHAQNARADIAVAHNNYRTLIAEFRTSSTPIRRSRLTKLDYQGSNIQPDDHPMLHNLINQYWEATRTLGRSHRLPGAPTHLNVSDLGALQNGVTKSFQITAILDNELIEPIVADCRNVGMKIWKDPNGFYRWDRSVRPRL